MVREPLANTRTVHEPNVRVDGTANLCCTVCEWFAYCSWQTKICWFFVWTQRALGVPRVLCSPQVRRKLIYHAPNANCSRTIWFACVYWPLHFCFRHYQTCLKKFHFKKAPGGVGRRAGVLICCLGHHFRTFSALGWFWFFFLILISLA